MTGKLSWPPSGLRPSWQLSQCQQRLWRSSGQPGIAACGGKKGVASDGGYNNPASAFPGVDHHCSCTLSPAIAIMAHLVTSRALIALVALGLTSFAAGEQHTLSQPSPFRI